MASNVGQPSCCTEMIIYLNSDRAVLVHYPDAISNAGEYFVGIRDTSPWAKEQIKLGGRICNVARTTCYYGDPDTELKYSGITARPEPWSPIMTKLKKEVEALTDVKYNFCALSLYKDGNDCIGSHSDKERSLVKGMPIASISLGATRDFLVKTRKDAIRNGRIGEMDTLKIPLSHGDLLIMGKEMQRNYMHGVPKRANVESVNINGESTISRINLTFRVTKTD